MASRLIGAKPLSEPILAYYQLGPQKPTSEIMLIEISIAVFIVENVFELSAILFLYLR